MDRLRWTKCQFQRCKLCLIPWWLSLLPEGKLPSYFGNSLLAILQMLMCDTNLNNHLWDTKYVWNTMRNKFELHKVICNKYMWWYLRDVYIKILNCSKDCYKYCGWESIYQQPTRPQDYGGSHCRKAERKKAILMCFETSEWPMTPNIKSHLKMMPLLWKQQTKINLIQYKLQKSLATKHITYVNSAFCVSKISNMGQSKMERSQKPLVNIG